MKSSTDRKLTESTSFHFLVKGLLIDAFCKKVGEQESETRLGRRGGGTGRHILPQGGASGENESIRAGREKYRATGGGKEKKASRKKGRLPGSWRSPTFSYTEESIQKKMTFCSFGGQELI